MPAVISGKFPATVGRSQSYFEQRHTWLDCRGTLRIDAQSHWGFYVRVITTSHEIQDGVNATGMGIGIIVDRPVVVERDVWIGSSALLYNCIIHEGAVVAVGSVVSSCEVAPRVIVAGNPARVVARWSDHGWLYETPKWRLLS